MYQNPLDPSVNTAASKNPADYSCSYVSNAQVLSMRRSLTSGISDGLSNTIFFSEHYRVCSGSEFYVFSIIRDPRRFNGVTAPTFADANYSPRLTGSFPDADYAPITSGNPRSSTSIDGSTFQSKPTLKECDVRLPNAASTRGLQACMGDGSVRTIRIDVAPTVFWAAVTPDGGEVLASDW